MDKKRLLNRIKREFLLFLDAFDMDKYAELGPYGQIRFKKRIPPATYYSKLRRFEKNGLLKKKPNVSGIFVISQKAKNLRRSPSKKVPRNDGFASLIIFDIPQEKRNARDTLRRFLIRNGYTKIRESCFLSPFVVSNDILDLIIELKLEHNVSAFSAKPDYLFK